jgi:DNA-binding NtrC family response regulator
MRIFLEFVPGHEMELINIVVVDDEWVGIKSKLAELGKENGFTFSGVSEFSIDKVLQEVVNAKPSILLLDIMGPKHIAGTDGAGIDLFKSLGTNKAWAALCGGVQIVFFSDAPSVRRHAVVGRAQRVDVSGFVGKDDLYKRKPEALQILKGAANLASMYADCPLLADPELRKLSDLVFSPNSHAMHDVWRQIVLAGRCHENVFVSGETGAGKELVAKAVFNTSVMICDESVKAKRRSSRSRGYHDFFPLNIAALPAEGNLQYIELFGAEPESYSGITKPRKGLFEVAHDSGRSAGHPDNSSGGTVFLDEIGDAAPIVQVALLRVLQEGTITPLGGLNSGKSNKKVVFRLITASHSLLANVKSGSFREDLYYRLNGLHIHMPPLRERTGDIGILAQHFIDKLNEEYQEEGWERIEIGDAEGLVQKLSGYHWPGNVRELEMAIRASYVTTTGKTFQLSEEVEHRIAGREPIARANVEQLLEALRNKPQPITEIAKIHGKLVALDVYRSLTPAGRRLDESTVQQLFGPEANRDTLHRWAKRAENELLTTSPSIQGGPTGNEQQEEKEHDA